MKNIWENPEIQCINRLPMRSPLFPYSDENLALAETVAGPENCEFTKSRFVKSLDGKWKFNLIQNPKADQTEALCNWADCAYSDKNWNDIKVPGTWTLQGFDKPHYTNVQMPFDNIPPNVPEENPTGLYRLNAEIPFEWENRRIVLHIGSAESVVVVYVNGKEVGVSKDTRLPCEFEISPYIDWNKTGNMPGKALIAIKVIRYSDASFVEDQDQWWFGGIHRSVYLYSTEQVFIADAQAISTAKNLSSDGKTGTGIIPLEVTLGFSDFKNEVTRRKNSELNPLEYTVKYSICELTGKPDSLQAGKIVSQGEDKIAINLRQDLNQLRKTIEIENVRLWSTESPNLYAVTVSLYEADKNRLIETSCFTTGFKTVEIKNRELLFNNKMIYIHGVNRHEHNPYHGKTITTAEMVKDLHLLKAFNFNAVRTCHYPDDERWYDLCDRYGIYIMDEANIENHAYYDVMARSDEWTYSYMARVQRMIRRDKNHACIFSWSLGNESGDGQNQVACAAWLRRVDPTRIVHYEGFVRAPWKQTGFTLETLARGKGLTDLISPMYPSIDLIVDYVNKCEDYRPLIMCEYSHAMGNANGSLADYWKAIESNHGLQGGFIWDWIDQGIASDADISPEAAAVAEKYMSEHPNGQGGLYYKYGSDFGDLPTDYDFCLNGLIFPDQSPKPATEECRLLFAPVRLTSGFEIENRFSFTDLSVLKMKWQLLSNGEEIASGTQSLPPLAPGKKQELIINGLTEKLAGLQKAVQSAKAAQPELYFKAFFVYEEDFYSYKKDELCSYDGFVVQEASGVQSYSEKSGLKHLAAEDVSSIIKNAKTELFRAMLENEGIKAEIPMVEKDGDLRSFNDKPTWQWLSKNLSDNAEKYAGFTSRVEEVKTKDGKNALRLECEFNLSEEISEYPRAGISLKIPAGFENIRWYGNGPHECYSDRCYSALKGMYQSKCADMEVRYIVPQENGERCGVKYLELFEGADNPAGNSQESSNRIIHFQSESDFAFTISKYEIKDQFACRHLAELTDTTKLAEPYWNLTIDAAHRGVGTGACGPDTLPQYRVKPGKYKLSLLIW